MIIQFRTISKVLKSIDHTEIHHFYVMHYGIMEDIIYVMHSDYYNLSLSSHFSDNAIQLSSS